MKTLTFNSTELKTIVQEQVLRATGIRTDFVKADHGYVDSDVFFKELDLNTGKYRLKDEPTICYGYSQVRLGAGNFVEALAKHLRKSGLKMVTEPIYELNIPESTLRLIRDRRDSFYGTIDAKLSVTVTVKSNKFVQLMTYFM